jgi:hypothetical protein
MSELTLLRIRTSEEIEQQERTNENEERAERRRQYLERKERGDKTPRKLRPKCACGCGRGARWPLYDPSPVFYARLCGYQMALEMIRKRKKRR